MATTIEVLHGSSNAKGHQYASVTPRIFIVGSAYAYAGDTLGDYLYILYLTKQMPKTLSRPTSLSSVERMESTVDLLKHVAAKADVTGIPTIRPPAHLNGISNAKADAGNSMLSIPIDHIYGSCNGKASIETAVLDTTTDLIAIAESKATSTVNTRATSSNIMGFIIPTTDISVPADGAWHGDYFGKTILDPHVNYSLIEHAIIFPEPFFGDRFLVEVKVQWYRDEAVPWDVAGADTSIKIITTFSGQTFVHDLHHVEDPSRMDHFEQGLTALIDIEDNPDPTEVIQVLVKHTSANPVTIEAKNSYIIFNTL